MSYLHRAVHLEDALLYLTEAETILKEFAEHQSFGLALTDRQRKQYRAVMEELRLLMDSVEQDSVREHAA